MNVNEVLARHNFITKIQLKSDEGTLSKDLKVKIMAMRIEYGKVRRAFDEDVQEFIKGVTPEGFAELQNKPDKTEEELAQLQEMINKINGEYTAYIQTRSAEEVTVNNTSLTEDEYNEIVGISDADEYEINNQKILAADFLEILYSLFVQG